MAEENKKKTEEKKNNAQLHKLAQEQRKTQLIQTGSIGRIEGLLSKISKNTESKGLLGGILGGIQKVKVKKDTYKTDDFDPRESVKVLKSIESLLGEQNKKKEGFGMGGILKALVIGGIGVALGNLMDMDDVKALGPVKVLMKTYKVYQQTIKMIDKVKNIFSGKTLFTKFGKVFDKVKNFFNPVTKAMDKAQDILSGGTLFTGKFGKIFDKAKDFFGPVITVVDKAKNFFSPVMTVVDGAKKMFQPVLKLLGGGAKVGAVAGKLGLKALAKIPGLGLIAAIALAVPRFKSGDIIGGMMELASGAAAIFPGVGTGIALAIDAALLMKDVSEGGWGKSVMNSVTSFLGFGGNKKKMEGNPRKGFIDNSNKGLVNTKLGKQSEGGLDNGIPIVGRATSLMAKSGVDLNNLDFGPNHDSIDEYILDSYGKHLGGSYSPVITSARRTSQGNAALEESVKKSKHLTGNALDLRVNDIDIETSNAITKSLANSLGKDFDVLQHGKGDNRHIHLEYDPKGSGYKDGGIVPGSSMIGDRVPARVNSGEMILNLAQQTQLFKVANGGGVDQNIPHIDLAAMNASSNMKDMMSFLTEKFAVVLSNKIAEATENAVKKRPKSNSGTIPDVDIT